MAAIEHTDMGEFEREEYWPHVSDFTQPPLLGILLIGLTYSVISGVVAYLLGAGFWLVLAAYVFGGSIAIVLAGFIYSGVHRRICAIDRKEYQFDDSRFAYKAD
ncbi:hypothetical protein [Roseobacter sp. N2S]|uniref:hypothetical protein n=1 Tax=Roseobacter sp. N2S TaxID=2663844 RepID=UPI0028596C1C|nr:hypothetical protein [Roseobacter sp. N2S]MDR6267710.1 hypothetical protein [Roseobacter sp. N2S]